MKSTLSTLLVCLISWAVLAQSGTRLDVQWADSILQYTKDSETLQPDRKIELLDSVALVFKEHDRLCSHLDARVRSAASRTDNGSVDSAIAVLIEVQKMYQPGCDSTILMGAYNNLSYAYLMINDFSKVDSMCVMGLGLWNDEWEEYRPKLSMINNWSISRAYQGDFVQADALFRRLLRESRQFESFEYQSKALVKRGTVKGMEEDRDRAYYFFKKAGEVAVQGHDLDTHVPILINLASVDINRGNFNGALLTLDSAQVVADMLNQLDYVAMVENAKSETYEGSGDFQQALSYLKQYNATREKILDEQKIKAVTEMEEKYESEKSARQIKELEVKNLDSELQNERITRSRNRFIFAGGAVVVLAFGLASRLRYVRRSRAAIQREKDISEGLLLNILPEEVAEELKTKGEAEAQLMDPVTVLFTDFKGFTALSEMLSPKELVKDLNECFSAFDHIMGKHGIEKIKTIGDAYMAAAGLPVPQEDHAERVIRAALEMRDFIEAGKAAKIEQGKPYFEIRIGVHTGPVVAGIVGVKKFQYDIWGDTVNTASRMESSGEVGQVNISASTYAKVKDRQEYTFSHRGKIQAKGKGELDMYFVNQS